MDDKERTRRHLKEAQRQAKLGEAIPKEASREIVKLLNAALKEIRATLGGLPSEWQQHHFSVLKGSVKSALGAFEKGADGTLSRSAMRAWHAGQDAVDKPLAAGGIFINKLAPGLSTERLLATQVFLTDRIQDISAQAIRRVNTQLGLVMLGVKQPSEVATELQKVLNVSRSRALTIMRTELGRANETAHHMRRLQAKELLPGLQKMWRRSGKLHSRLTHDAADGQIRDPDEHFQVGGEDLLFPRDPNGSAKNTINCGCTTLDHMDHWKTQFPGKKPFTAEELAANPLRRDLQQAGAYALSVAATRAGIEQNLASSTFTSWFSKPDSEAKAVGVIDTDMKGWTGSTGSVVRLSQQTLTKQLKHHPDLGLTAYQLLPMMIATGEVIREGGAGSPLHIYVQHAGNLYRAILKLTQDGSELYLVSLTRARDKQRQNQRQAGNVLREQKE